jgi:hypothetical protein
MRVPVIQGLPPLRTRVTLRYDGVRQDVHPGRSPVDPKRALVTVPLQTPGYSLATMQRPIGLLTLAACFILAGALLDGGYQRSTPGSLPAQGTIVDFERRHSRQVYPVFEFNDADGVPHRVVSSTQQGIARFSKGDSVPVAYSRIDPERARIDTLWFSHRWLIGGIIAALAIVIRALAGAGLKQN